MTEREQTAVVSEEKKEEKKEDAKEEDKSTDKKDEKKKEGESGDEKPAAHQIWLISPYGGEAWQLTRHPSDVGEFHWSKDAKQIEPTK